MRHAPGWLVGWVKGTGPVFFRELHALACLYWGLWFPMVALFRVSMTCPLGKISGVVGIVLTYLGLGHAIVNAASASGPLPAPVAPVQSLREKEADHADA